MAKYTTDVKNENGDNTSVHFVKKAKTSKFNSINHMTIPNIEKAKAVIKGKLDGNPSREVRAKLIELQDQYEMAESEIRKFHRNYARNPKTQNIMVGGRRLKDTVVTSLTIAQINNKNYNKKDKHLKFGLRDRLRATNLNKWALGIGIASLSLGVAGQITQAAAGKSLLQLLKIAVEAMWKNNPAALVMIGAGAALIAASKIVPAIDRSATNTARRIRESRMRVNEATNEAYAAGADLPQSEASAAEPAQKGGNITQEQEAATPAQDSEEKVVPTPETFTKKDIEKAREEGAGLAREEAEGKIAEANQARDEAEGKVATANEQAKAAQEAAETQKQLSEILFDLQAKSGTMISIPGLTKKYGRDGLVDAWVTKIQQVKGDKISEAEARKLAELMTQKQLKENEKQNQTTQNEHEAENTASNS